MQKLLCSFDSKWLNSGILLLRVGIGAIFIIHGLQHIMGGSTTWSSLGSQMGLFGIHFAPLFWGLLAAATEFAGGTLLILGLFTRVAALFLTFVMVVALTMHVHNGDSFLIYSHALSMLVVFISIGVAGGGKYSLDGYSNQYL